MNSAKSSCPNCGSTHIQSKEYKIRKIKHALFLNRQTVFYLKIKRYRCVDCKKTFSQSQNFAPKNQKVSFDTIKALLLKLQNYSCTFEQAAKDVHVSSTTAMNIFDTYVNPKRKPLPKILSLDEVYNKNQFSSAYSCILFDFLNMKIIDVIQDRSKSSLRQFFQKVSQSEKDNVEFVVIDMWEPYLDTAKIFFPKAIVVVDSFHVIQNMERSLDSVRCRVMRRFEPNTTEYFLLKKYHDLLHQYCPIDEEKIYSRRFKMYLNRYDIVKMILSIDKDLKFSHEFVSNYRFFNKHSTFETCKIGFEKFENDSRMLEIPEFVPIIKMLQNWKEQIINSFMTVDGRRISNGPIEGCNSQIKKLMKISNGLLNPLRFRNRLIHCYNKDISLSPAKEKIAKIVTKKRGKYKKKPSS